MTDDTRISELAQRVLALARDSIIVKFRFFDKALASIKLEEAKGTGRYAGSAGRLTYDPARLLSDYANDENFAVRLLLHVIFHNIFMHYSRRDITNRKYWDIACDIAVENAVLAVAGEYQRLDDTNVQTVLSRLNKWVPHLTAELLYREFMVGGISTDSAAEYARLFPMDEHVSFDAKEREEITVTAEEWEKIARRIRAELKSFSRDIKGGDTILFNLREAVRKKYDYDDIIKRFAVMSEEIRVSPDEFDYIYYTYGLSQYGNMPLIEPLEYTDEKKIKEFVIAVDTSASVRGKLVEGFLEKTYDLLSRSVSFSETMNVHIIQCDSDVTSDITIRNKNDLSAVVTGLQVRGFGATDFRPVFEYVDNKISNREFTNLRGLIYFTDGYGIYPVTPPKYDTMFVFGSEDDFRPPVPGWAIRVVVPDL